jgi:hypothetical protein
MTANPLKLEVNLENDEAHVERVDGLREKTNGGEISWTTSLSATRPWHWRGAPQQHATLTQSRGALG